MFAGIWASRDRLVVLLGGAQARGRRSSIPRRAASLPPHLPAAVATRARAGRPPADAARPEGRDRGGRLRDDRRRGGANRALPRDRGADSRRPPREGAGRQASPGLAVSPGRQPGVRRSTRSRRSTVDLETLAVTGKRLATRTTHASGEARRRLGPSRRVWRDGTVGYSVGWRRPSAPRAARPDGGAPPRRAHRRGKSSTARRLEPRARAMTLLVTAGTS